MPLIFALLFLFLFKINSSSLAADIILEGLRESEITDSSQELTVLVELHINSHDGTVYYLRGAFFKENTSNYCGLTWNGSSWYGGPYTSQDGWKNLPSVSVASGSASTEIKARVDPEDSGCKESGNYFFKIIRYTVSGSSSSDNQTPLAVLLSLPTITPTPAPTAKITWIPVAKAGNLESVKTSITTQMPSAVKTADSAVSTPGNILITSKLLDGTSASIAGYQATVSSNLEGKPGKATAASSSLVAQIKNNRTLILLMLTLGVVFLSAGIFQSFRIRAGQRHSAS